MDSMDNTAMGPRTDNDFQSLRPRIGGDRGLPPFNTTVATPYHATADSSHIDVYTGIMDYGKLTKLRERAVYDLNTLSRAPVVDSGKGVLFPNAVEAKTTMETQLRVRPTSFKGRQQLDVGDQDGDVHLNRQMHPNGTNISNQAWYRGDKADAPFVGFPNPDMFYFYTDAIPTHNVQNLSHSQMMDLMRATQGDYDHNDYLKHVGALMRTKHLEGTEHASAEYVVPSNGGGVNSDPRLLMRLNEEYEQMFQKAKRMQTDAATHDPRFNQSAPGVAYTAEQHKFAEQQEDYFSKLSDRLGIPTSYTESIKLHV
mmetsp:Transcript_9923/g.25099  ORF Transcript_9923/g.25099 Transcript_9923/m.25099 type:complete len:312 (+) Transcript_9923:33-968(+)